MEKYVKYKTKYLRLLNGSGQRGGDAKGDGEESVKNYGVLELYQYEIKGYPKSGILPDGKSLEHRNILDSDEDCSVYSYDDNKVESPNHSSCDILKTGDKINYDFTNNNWKIKLLNFYKFAKFKTPFDSGDDNSNYNKIKFSIDFISNC